jgi:hypothetical protein
MLSGGRRRGYELFLMVTLRTVPLSYISNSSALQPPFHLRILHDFSVYKLHSQVHSQEHTNHEQETSINYS